MENQSIFNTELSTTSNNHIYSASRWARFLGIVLFVLAALYVIIGIIMMTNMDDISNSMSAFPTQNPMLDAFARSPVALIGFIMFIFIGLLVWQGILLTKMATNGLNYYASNEEDAFIQSFEASKNFFKTIAIFLIIYLSLILLFAIIGAAAFAV